MQHAALLLLTLFVVGISAMMPQHDVKVTMGAVPNTPRLVIQFNVTNPSSMEKLSMLSYGTPFEGMEMGLMGPIFTITDKEGNEIPYVGKLARRAYPPIDPTSAYLVLGPLDSHSILVDITDEYEFPGAGEYRIQFNPPLFDEQLNFINSDVDNVIVGRLPIINRRNINNNILGANCNPTETSQVNAAVVGARSESLTAYNCMSKRTCSATSTRWFGTYNQANYEYDTGVFNKVYSRLQNFAFNPYCNPAGCGSNVYAYVYPTDSTYTVYLCGAFWSQPSERVNTVVHEMSHFNTLGGTQDYAYGKTACLNLAKSNPARASRNADNVCYFSEEAK